MWNFVMLQIYITWVLCIKGPFEISNTHTQMENTNCYPFEGEKQMLTEKLRENKTNLSIYLLTLSVIYVFFKFFIDHFLNLMHLYIVTVLLNLINWTYLFLLNKMMSATRIITVCNLLNSNFRTTSSLSALSPWFLYIHFLPVTGLTTCSLGLFRTCF